LWWIAIAERHDRRRLAAAAARALDRQDLAVRSPEPRGRAPGDPAARRDGRPTATLSSGSPARLLQGARRGLPCGLGAFRFVR
jgi:hypothetical protein